MARTMFPLRPPDAAAPRIGLLATFRPDTVPEREVGFTFNPESCAESGVGDPDPCNTTHDKTIPDGPDLVEAEPFYAWAGDKCSLWDWQEREFQARARRQLAASLSYQVAHELWTGDQAQAQGSPNRFLASEDSDVLTDGATSITDAIARLEQGMANCIKGAGSGVIHLPPAAATYMHQLNLLVRQGNILQTILGTLVVVDAGYDGSSPLGTPATDDSVWAYATGGIIVRIGPERLVPEPGLDSGQAITRSTNTVEYRAERMAAVGWDGCCHLAVEMDIGWLNEGGPGS